MLKVITERQRPKMARNNLGKLVSFFNKVQRGLGVAFRRASGKSAKSLEKIIVTRIERGQDAFGNPMPQLRPASVQANVVVDGVDQNRRRDSYGNHPMLRTRKTVQDISAVTTRDGFKIVFESAHAQSMVAMHYNDVSIAVSGKMKKYAQKTLNINLSGKNTIERKARPLVGINEEDMQMVAETYADEIVRLMRGSV